MNYREGDKVFETLDLVENYRVIPKDITVPLNRFIDHSLLKPEATDVEFEKFLDDAVKYQFAAVCVSPRIATAIAAAMKTEPNIAVCTVVGFPHGNIPLDLKIQQVEYFLKGGIDEIDFVLGFGELCSLRQDLILQELRIIGDLVHSAGAISKCIVETCYLTETDKRLVFKYIQDNSNIDFIKTSTGFGSAGAQLEDVKMWTEMRGDSIGPRIKAAGGIRDLETAMAFIEAGAERLGMGSPASVEVMEAYNEKRSS